MGAIPSFAFMVLHPDALLRADCFLLFPRASRTDSRVRDFGHADIPIRIAWHPREGVCRDRKHSRPVVGLAPIRARLRDRQGCRNGASAAPIASACLTKSTWRGARILHPAIDEQIVEAGTPLACCRRLMTAKPPLSQTTTIILWPVRTDE